MRKSFYLQYTKMKTCITDQRISEECLEHLCELGYPAIKLPPVPGLSSAVASHTDIILFHHKNTLIASKEYFSTNASLADEIRAALPSHNIILSDERQRGRYPYDAIFNALVIGKYLFAKTDTVCPDILRYAEISDLTVVHTNQGYPACTVLPVGQSAAVTADFGMARLMSDCGIEVLTVSQDEAIKLPPYRNGFIGGAAGAFDDKILFIGNFDALSEHEKISVFLKKHGYRAISLDPDASVLFDLGGILFCE